MDSEEADAQTVAFGETRQMGERLQAVRAAGIEL
jgi:hypothetical protein